ncbi:MAG: DUF4390 domain-containing protein [Pseudomonadota bacterium]
MAHHQSCNCSRALLGCALSVVLSVFCVGSVHAERGEPRPPPPAPEDPYFAGITHAETTLVDGVFYLSCQSRLELPELAEEALINGLPLVFALTVEVARARAWWFDEVVATAAERFQIQHFELSRHYRVTRMSNGTSSTHSTLASALRQVGSLRQFPLIESQHLEEDSDYTGTLVLALDAGSLPLPLRPQVFLSPDWELQSEEFSWDIR